ncbi:hypothetical protein EWM64_g9159 [Hericium alpestre]|uniref:C3H1-type domain-containing protein n=1 Tax=Hericium alpestre TaxID=135208 RepID=A0A4Y9ZLM1_9AGAM|nr:hypothetical protein EWM64_g9159 [Hericium alpestre]
MPAFDAQTVKACMDVVASFRTGICSRVEAIFDIHDALRDVTQIPKATVLQASQAYIRMLDSWERSQQAAHEHGTRANGNTGASSTAGAGRPTVMQATEVESATPECDTHSVGTTKCCHAEFDNDSNDNERAPRKRPLDFAELPWFENEKDDSPLLSELLEQTRRLVLVFAEDQRQWKTFFTNRRDCPQFPDAEWVNIIAGRAINLDAVHSSMFSVALESKHKEKVGQLSITIDNIVPSKTIKTHGDWLAAWERTSAAIAFIFRHRSSELDGYRSHISQLFTMLGPSMPDPVLNYDRGVRLRTAARRNLLLTDVISFLDLQTHYITIGARLSNSVPQPSRSRSSGKPRKHDPCRRWNDGKCPNTSKDCNYLHCCTKCTSPGHTAGACTGRT